MQAFNCDRCGCFFAGAPEMKVKTNKIILAINYMPESKEESWYIHDLC